MTGAGRFMRFPTTKQFNQFPAESEETLTELNFFTSVFNQYVFHL
jgi:hypothetical protein